MKQEIGLTGMLSFGCRIEKEEEMTKYVVTIYAFGGKLMERVGGFTSRDEANEYASKEFMRSDVGSVHVTEDEKQGGTGRYR
jgi:hypothetical protein